VIQYQQDYTPVCSTNAEEVSGYNACRAEVLKRIERLGE